VAFAVAVAGARMRPPVPSPPALKPYLRFQKLPSAALGPVRRAVDSDDEFRQRIAAVVDEELAGRVGWLWLHRPDGWTEEVAELVAAEQAGEAAATEQRQERAAIKRVEAAEATARRATGEIAAVRAELAGEHDRRVEAEASRTRLERRVTQLEVELTGARRRVGQADDERAAAAERVAAADERASVAAARAAVAEAHLAEAEARARVAEAALELARHGGEAPAALAAPVSPSPGPVSPSPAPVVPEPMASVVPAANGPLVEALRDAAAATERLGAALAAAAAAVAPSGDACPPDHVRGAGRAARSSRPVRPAAHRRPRRTPLALPGGVFADTVEAATHLVRQPGVLLVVDGYNAAKRGWPDDGLAVQRERLLDALEELVARHGTAVHVVFDGADLWTAPPGRRHLRIEFSPAGVSADDVIVDLVGSLPADRPVVVATNDGEVRAGARAGGANVISSEQLLAVARRS
jgi:predicted RNA-binding protein with PIN domain